MGIRQREQEKARYGRTMGDYALNSEEGVVSFLYSCVILQGLKSKEFLLYSIFNK